MDSKPERCPLITRTKTPSPEAGSEPRPAYSEPSESMLARLDATRRLPFFKRVFRAAGPGSLRTAVISFLRMTTGLGPFTLPFFLSQFGAVPGALLVVLAAAISYLSFSCYFEAQVRCGKTSIAGVVAHFLPRWTARTFRVTLCLDMVCCQMFTLIIGWNMLAYLLFIFGMYREEWLVDPFTLQFQDYHPQLFLVRAVAMHAIFLLILPLLLRKDLEHLRVVSKLFLATLALIILIIFAQVPLFFSRYHSPEAPEQATQAQLFKNFADFAFLKFGFSILLSFYGQTQAFPIRSQIIQPSLRRLRKVSALGIGINLAFLLPFALVCYFTWGDRYVPPLIFLRRSIEAAPVLETIFRVCLVLFVVINFVGVSCFNPSVREVFIGLFWSKGGRGGLTQTRRRESPGSSAESPPSRRTPSVPKNSRRARLNCPFRRPAGRTRLPAPPIPETLPRPLRQVTSKTSFPGARARPA